MAITQLQTGAIKKKGRGKLGGISLLPSSNADIEKESKKKTTPKKAPPKKPAKKDSPKGEATTTSDYFASSGKTKPARSTPTKSRAYTEKTAATTPVKAPFVNATPKASKAKNTSLSKPVTNGRTSSRKKTTTSYVEHKDEDDEAFLDDKDDARDDVFTAEFKKGDDYEEEEEEEVVKLPRRSAGKGKQASLVEDEDEVVPEDKDVDMKDVNADDDFVVPDPEEEIVLDKPKKGRKPPTPTAGKKRKSVEFDEDQSDDGFDAAPKKIKAAKTQSPAKKPPAKKVRAAVKDKEEETAESKEIQDILDTIPTVRPPSPPTQSGEPKKFSFRDHAQRTTQTAPASGSKEIPTGAENCLSGLTFVFTGLLDALGREEGQELVKRYGGKVTGAPSAKTSYVVLGTDAGPKKLSVIQEKKLTTINEDGLFELIRRLPANGGDSKAAEKNEEKKRQEEKKIKEMAAEMAKEDKRVGSAGGASGGSTGKSSASGAKAQSDSRLWTVKYAPTQTAQICGNKGQVTKLQTWLRNWQYNAKFQFKKAGADGSGVYRAIIIHGPPGIGKTTAAHLAARLEGFDVVESNASDTRSKKLVESGLKGILDTTSLLGYFAGEGKKVEAVKKKLVLIMDEVDGMSAGDRGGVGALAAVCKKTSIPMILICNDRKLPKMRPFDHVTYDLPFRRPTTNDIRSRIMTICYREGLKMPPSVIDALIEGSHADIRQIINMISTAKLDQDAMDFDQSKSMSQAWQKHVILKPWDIVSKLLGGGLFHPNSKATLNDKIELYFNDHEFSYLMLQENYLGTSPILAQAYSGKERSLKLLELADNAAESISDGDLVDRMIHGPQQQWSLMPTHAVFSTVRPASFISGSMAGHGQTRFTQWLGNNSKLGKLTRFVKEIQGHMRLRASGDRHEIRQQYLPTLWYQLIKKLETEGKECVPDVIELMDSYFLTKDDWDAILELGLGPMDMDAVKLESQAKATFTRLYNQQSHPLPFMKASNVVAPKKSSKDKPDLEEAIDESDDGEELIVEADAQEDDEELDLSKDKYVKAPKKKAAAKKATQKKAPAKSKGKAKEESEDEELDDDSEEDVKPKKGRGGAKAWQELTEKTTPEGAAINFQPIPGMLEEPEFVMRVSRLLRSDDSWATPEGSIASELIVWNNRPERVSTARSDSCAVESVCTSRLDALRSMSATPSNVEDNGVAYVALKGVYEVLMETLPSFRERMLLRAEDPHIERTPMDDVHDKWAKKQRVDECAEIDFPQDPDPSKRTDVPKTPPHTASPTFSNQTSAQTLKPEDAIVECTIDLTTAALNNLNTLQVLRDKEYCVRRKPGKLCVIEPSIPTDTPSANDIVCLLATQGQRRRKQIHDERKGAIYPGLEDRAARRRSLYKELRKEEQISPPPTGLPPTLPYSLVDEKKVALFTLSETPKDILRAEPHTAQEMFNWNDKYSRICCFLSALRENAQTRNEATTSMVMDLAPQESPMGELSIPYAGEICIPEAKDTFYLQPNVYVAPKSPMTSPKKVLVSKHVDSGPLTASGSVQTPPPRAAHETDTRAITQAIQNPSSSSGATQRSVRRQKANERLFDLASSGSPTPHGEVLVSSTATPDTITRQNNIKETLLHLNGGIPNFSDNRAHIDLNHRHYRDVGAPHLMIKKPRAPSNSTDFTSEYSVPLHPTLLTTPRTPNPTKRPWNFSLSYGSHVRRHSPPYLHTTPPSLDPSYITPPLPSHRHQSHSRPVPSVPHHRGQKIFTQAGLAHALADDILGDIPPSPNSYLATLAQRMEQLEKAKMEAYRRAGRAEARVEILEDEIRGLRERVGWFEGEWERLMGLADL
ncbi:MAG: hypothetical protein M1827_004990 [Pycnora praestabilis]|nr:MAG: hypothetical protein M1827_004990 [Pycnora praestabilis]